jgi:predicted translin family RNA/ssDNA-binding protein
MVLWEPNDRNMTDVFSTGRSTTAILARAHSTPSDQIKPVLDDAAAEINAQKQEVLRLKAVADQHPFYKYNGLWTRELQNLVASIELCAWLGGLEEHKGSDSASFMTIEDVGKFLEIPVNLKEQDAFHLTIEEYLLALIAMVEELSRLAVNSVTLGDYTRPLQISNFIKDLFSGFQLLNLKNDILRKRSDGVKYSVKKVEDVVYDLSLRNLIPKGGASA